MTATHARRRNSDDVAEVEAHDLDYPATTSAVKVAAKGAGGPANRMTVIQEVRGSTPLGSTTRIH